MDVQIKVRTLAIKLVNIRQWSEIVAPLSLGVEPRAHRVTVLQVSARCPLCVYRQRPVYSPGAKKSRLGNLILNCDLEKLKGLLRSISDDDLRAEYGGVGSHGGRDGYGLFGNSSPLLHSALCGEPSIFAALLQAFSERQVRLLGLLYRGFSERGEQRDARRSIPQNDGKWCLVQG